MNRLWEAIFGLKRGFLNQPGELSLGFNPKWPQSEHETNVSGAFPREAKIQARIFTADSPAPSF